jgi:hypothetical protein
LEKISFQDLMTNGKEKVFQEISTARNIEGYSECFCHTSANPLPSSEEIPL